VIIFYLFIEADSSFSQPIIEGNMMTSIMAPTSRNILVTGGSGYIAVHTIVCLLEAGYDVTAVDNCHNSSPEGLKRVLEITKIDLNRTPNRLRFFQADMNDEEAFEETFRNSPRFEACIHFAGLKAVGESVQKPLFYYENNIGLTLVLLNLMEKYDCRSIIFSSSATVYGAAEVPITEDSQVGVGITNPYGKTKYFIEEILKVKDSMFLFIVFAVVTAFCYFFTGLQEIPRYREKRPPTPFQLCDPPILQSSGCSSLWFDWRRSQWSSE
jgi:UDP-glucose 4-epimerase